PRRAPRPSRDARRRTPRRPSGTPDAPRAPPCTGWASPSPRTRPCARRAPGARHRAGWCAGCRPPGEPRCGVASRRCRVGVAARWAQVESWGRVLVTGLLELGGRFESVLDEQMEIVALVQDLHLDLG